MGKQRLLGVWVAGLVSLFAARAVGAGAANAPAPTAAAKTASQPTKAAAPKGSQPAKPRHKKGFSGKVARPSQTGPLLKPSGKISVIHRAVNVEAKVNIYNPDGSFNEAALAELDNVFQCRRTHEVRAVDPHLYEQLSRIYDHFGERRIELTSGFRYQRNEGSRHFHASAMDIRIPGVRMDDVVRFAQGLDRGGMGIGRYPREGFVHIDFRAPGEPSYRWTDKSRARSSSGKSPSRMWHRKRSNS